MAKNEHKVATLQGTRIIKIETNAIGAHYQILHLCTYVCIYTLIKIRNQIIADDN